MDNSIYENLSPEAKAEWDRVTSDSKKKYDQTVLHTYCEAVATYERAKKECLKYPLVGKRDDKTVTNPYQKIINEQSNIISKLSKQLKIDRNEAVMKIADKSVRFIEGKVLYSSSRLADFLEITNKTLTMWNKEGCPKVATGWWDIEEVLKWRGLIGGGAYATEEKAKAKNLYARKMEAEIMLKEYQMQFQAMKNSIQNGELLRRDDVIRELASLFAGIKTVIRTVPRKCASQLTGLIDSSEIRRIEASMIEVIDNQLIQLGNGEFIAEKAKAKKIK
ncbi:MAG: P27 family phage terminase small subunit [Selenomonadaceae bacterium]